MTDVEKVDALFKEFGLLDTEGYLVGTDHNNVRKIQQRIDQLSRKTTLYEEEIEEARNLVSVNTAYIKELNKYMLHAAVQELDNMSESEEDEDYVPLHKDSDSEELSYDSTCTSEASEPNQ